MHEAEGIPNSAVQLFQRGQNWTWHSAHSALLQVPQSLFRRYHYLSYSTNSSHFIDPVCSLPHSQNPTTCLYPKPERSRPLLPKRFLKIHFNIIIPFTLRSLQVQFRTTNPHLYSRRVHFERLSVKPLPEICLQHHNTCHWMPRQQLEMTALVISSTIINQQATISPSHLSPPVQQIIHTPEPVRSN